MAVDALLVKVNEMEQRKPRYPQLYLPTYPLWKSMHRANAQVRHDQSGVTAGMLILSPIRGRPGVAHASRFLLQEFQCHRGTDPEDQVQRFPAPPTRRQKRLVRFDDSYRA